MYLYEAYAGEDKIWFNIAGKDHNNIRPESFHETVALFFWRALHCDSREPLLVMRPERIREVPSRSRLGDISYVDSQTGRRYTSRAHAERAAMRERQEEAGGEVVSPIAEAPSETDACESLQVDTSNGNSNQRTPQDILPVRQ